jgi:hypothetical protein
MLPLLSAMSHRGPQMRAVSAGAEAMAGPTVRVKPYQRMLRLVELRWRRPERTTWIWPCGRKRSRQRWRWPWEWPATWASGNGHMRQARPVLLEVLLLRVSGSYWHAGTCQRAVLLASVTGPVVRPALQAARCVKAISSSGWAAPLSCSALPCWRLGCPIFRRWASGRPRAGFALATHAAYPSRSTPA